MVIKARKGTSNLDRLAGIEYGGIAGCSRDCQEAVVRLLQHGDVIMAAKILTYGNTHALLLTINAGDMLAVNSGFSSGYGGEGPNTFSYILELLNVHGVEIDEYVVTEAVLERLDRSALRRTDIDALERGRPVRPRRWHAYVSDRHESLRHCGGMWREFPAVLPFFVIDPRLFDLARSFFSSPNDRIFDAYRLLEETVRTRTGLTAKSGKLFSAAFIGDDAPLRWPDCDVAEHAARADLFRATFTAYRNRRAHSPVDSNTEDDLSEFLLVNQLFRLEARAVVGKRNQKRRPHRLGTSGG
jgi:hypothetical protein